MGQLFIANELDSVLRTWEDMNLIGDLDFNFYLCTKQVGQFLPPRPAGSEKLDPLVGSEISILGTYARAIPEYSMLRKVLSGQSYTHPTNFLPRIPKDLRGAFATRNDFVFHQMVKSAIRLPLYLQKWNETKRACIVDDSIPIPSVDLREENWLGHMPYHAFYLQIKSPFVLNDGEDTWTIKNFIIYDDDSCIRIFFWADENAKHSLGAERTKEIQKAVDELRKMKFTNLSKKHVNTNSILDNLLLADFAIEKNGSGIVDIRGLECEKVVIDLYNYSIDQISSGDIDVELEIAAFGKMRAIVEMINGFCKLFSNIPPRNATTSIDRGKTHQPNNPPLQWMELPLQTVNYLHTDMENDMVVIRHGSGSEKSPHYRRGHYRRYFDENGKELHRVWIGEILVREDVLEKQLLRGGAIKVES